MAKITLKLQELAKKLGKSITEIAEETGLNRNTVTALYHNKVDGIKFETVVRFCETYKLSLIDLIEYQATENLKINADEYYKQEGEIIPFTGWMVGLQCCKFSKDYFDHDYGTLYMFWKKNYMFGFWHKNNTDGLAKEVYEKYSESREVDKLFNEYKKAGALLENYYYAQDPKDLLTSTRQQFLDFFDRLRQAYAQFWSMSLFIDAFDAGFDHQKIKEISSRFNFSLEEIGQLTTPREMTFNNERLLALYSLTTAFKKQRKYKNVTEFVKANELAQIYRKRFDYYQSNYAHAGHIAEHDLVAEIDYWLKNEDEMKSNFKELLNYSSDVDAKIKAILKKRKLTENPLYFFQVLTYWREHRKMINLMGIHLLFLTLDYLEEQSGIKLEFLKHLTTDEVEAVLNGTITQDVLERRFNEGIFVTFDENGYKMVVGPEAKSLYDQFNDNLSSPQSKIIYGQVASQGYARGVARIVLSREDFGKIHDGEILVTGMTRPEFLPIMKIAAAFVTNEGGITCHAAIVARELGKPCIIGTKNATQVIKDGDLIEVRANHGTVRILS